MELFKQSKIHIADGICLSATKGIRGFLYFMLTAFEMSGGTVNTLRTQDYTWAKTLSGMESSANVHKDFLALHG